MLRIVIILSILICCECVNIYSSFWAPLFDPRILNYNVDANFDPEAGRRAREQYEKLYGYKGQNLIADLSNGKGPEDSGHDNKVYGDVKFYYTYPGANN